MCQAHCVTRTVGTVTPDEFRANGYELIDMIADYLENVG